MAVTDIANSNLTFTGVPLGVQVTKVTDSSADWASVANSTYFYDKTDKLIHFKNSGGTVLEIFSAGGLTNFTEAEATTSPNNTVYVDSLTAAGSTTNVDVAIVPKGNGALLSAVPDSLTSGGNKRGQYAVDWQMLRNANYRIASGNRSVIIGGYNNGATNTYSIVGGESNQSLGYASVVFGASNLANTNAAYGVCLGSNNQNDGQSSVCLGDSNTITSGRGAALAAGGNNTVSTTGGYQTALGYFNTASGNVAAVIGYENISSGTASMAFGRQSTASGEMAVSIGYNAHTFGITGRFAYASGQEGTRGDAQTSKFVLHERTTGNTATTLTTDSGAASTTNQVILSNQSAYRFKGTIVGKQSGSTNASVWDVDGFIVRGANAAATTLIVGNVNLVSNTPAWGTPTLAADTTNGGLQVQVTGAAATNIQWTAVIETTEVIYA